MVCQKCQYPYANPLGCLSCGWVYNPDYHPEFGAAPVETAYWVLSQPAEVLEKLYGKDKAQAKIAMARDIIGSQKVPDAEPVKPKSKAKKSTVESIETQPVAKPDFSAPAVEEAVVVDERKMPNEATAPTVDGKINTREA